MKEVESLSSNGLSMKVLCEKRIEHKAQLENVRNALAVNEISVKHLLLLLDSIEDDIDTLTKNGVEEYSPPPKLGDDAPGANNDE